MVSAHHTASLFPKPDKFADQLSQSLQEKISMAIAQNSGWIGFDQYMQMALYEPGLGYYSAGSIKIGEQGDFITAPEISPLFSYCLARQCRQILMALPSPTCILEFGAGNGTMAIDILRQMERDNALPDTYYILEPSADLCQRQQQKFKQLAMDMEPRVIWLEQLPENKINGIILANEVFDAMPFKRICIDDEISEYGVTFASAALKGHKRNKFQWLKKTLEPDLQKSITNRVATLKEDLPTPYLADINFHIQPWLNSVNDILNKGMILISDYGYRHHEFFHPQRLSGTLVCHYRHHIHDDPFVYPGLQDISAAINFTDIAEGANNIGLYISGFTTQAHFLIACGLDDLITKHLNNTHKQVSISSAVSTLTLPSEMGEKFKFIGLNKSIDIQPMGFNFVDHKKRL